MRADRLLELGLVEALRLRLAGHDQARAVGGGRFQRLAGEEHDRGFHDGEHQRQERRRDQAEFDGGRAVLLADQAARGAQRRAAASRRATSLVCMFADHGQHPNVRQRFSAVQMLAFSKRGVVEMLRQSRTNAAGGVDAPLTTIAARCGCGHFCCALPPCAWVLRLPVWPRLAVK